MNKKFLKLPMLTLAAGIILRIADYKIAFTLVRGTSEWTIEMGNTAFYIRLILSVVVFVIIGMILRKEYDRKLILKSATLLVLYSIVVFALEQITQYYFTYSMIIYWLYIPIEMFITITSALARLSAAQTINWLYVIPSLFAPYLFVLFGKRNANSG